MKRRGFFASALFFATGGLLGQCKNDYEELPRKIYRIRSLLDDDASQFFYLYEEVSVKELRVGDEFLIVESNGDIPLGKSCFVSKGPFKLKKSGMWTVVCRTSEYTLYVDDCIDAMKKHT